jgi:hypothetical protein
MFLTKHEKVAFFPTSTVIFSIGWVNSGWSKSPRHDPEKTMLEIVNNDLDIQVLYNKFNVKMKKN